MGPIEVERDRDALILDNMAMARRIARRHRGRGLDADDLEGEAYAALVEAAEAHNSAAHPPESFAVLAALRIERRIAEAIDALPMIRPPRDMARVTIRCRRAQEVLIAAGDPNPSMEIIAGLAKVDLDLCREALEVPVREPDSGEFPRSIPDPERQQLLAEVNEVLDACSDLGRRVLLLHWVEKLPLNKVAQHLSRPLAEVKRAHGEACRAVTAEMERRGWTMESWARAIAS